MATMNSNIAEKQYLDNQGKLLPSSLGGRVREAFGIYTAAAADAAGTIVRLVKLPKGARLLPQSMVFLSAGDNEPKIKLGDEKDNDRYIAEATPSGWMHPAQADYVFEEEMAVIVTTTTAALTIGQKLTFSLFYVID